MTQQATRVMLVEDHFLARMALRAVLNGRTGVPIAADAQSGEEALALYQQVHPDVTLMDLRLPGVSGWDVIRRDPQIR